jgi:hypothetical protein
VVVEELEQPDGDHFEHVRTVPRRWWASRLPAGTKPLIRYRDSEETSYSISGSTRVCVEERAPACHTTFPSEEVLVSLRTMWDHQYAFSWETGDRFLLDGSVEIAPDFDGAIDESLSEGTGHVARVSWTVPDTMSRNSEEETEPDRVTTHAIYFDDGAPALLSTYQRPREDLARPGGSGEPEEVSGVALFPYTGENGTRLLVPVSFHPSGQRILLVPDLEEVGGGSGYTVHEPLDAEEPPSVAYVLTDGDGQPVETVWLRLDDVRP